MYCPSRPKVLEPQKGPFSTKGRKDRVTTLIQTNKSIQQ